MQVSCVSSAFLSIFLICCSGKPPYATNLESFTIHSVNTKDDYVIEIRRPDNFSPGDSCNLIYATDGSLGLGEYLLGKDKSWYAELPLNWVIVTIGHTGDWHSKRQRDFIPSDITGDSSENFGQATNFYSFLKDELIPLIDKRILKQRHKVLIGHSFGGLLCLYAALKNDHLFNHYFAISPSVWANYYELVKIEASFMENNDDFNTSIDVYAGSLEVFNKVLSSSKEFYEKISSKNYRNLHINFSIIKNANHFSIRKPAVDKILTILKEQ